MSKICDLCGKGYQKGNLVPRGIGRRVTNRAIVMKQPNLQTKRVTLGGITQKLSLCTSCIKRMKYEARKIESQLETQAE